MSIWIIFLLAINLIGLTLVWQDKSKSKYGSGERVPEVYFFFLSACFASLGVLAGIFFFHHKTKKIYFPLGLGVMAVQQVLLALYILKVI